MGDTVLPLLQLSFSPLFLPVSQVSARIQEDSHRWHLGFLPQPLLFTFSPTILVLNRCLSFRFKGRPMKNTFISKLHCSWPQVSSVHECSVRGSRVIFAGYSDYLGQIQKFAMRFSAANESESFMDSVKDTHLVPQATIMPERNCSELGTSQSELVWSNGVQYRDTDTEDNKPPLNCEDMQYTNSKDHDLKGNCATLPPYYTTPLSAARVAPKKETPEEVLADARHVRYMTSSSFNDMLTRLEMVISEMGGRLGTITDGDFGWTAKLPTLLSPSMKWRFASDSFKSTHFLVLFLLYLNPLSALLLWYLYILVCKVHPFTLC